MSNSSDYWRRREEEWLAQNRKTEEEITVEVEAIYSYMLDEIEKEIEAFFQKYAAKEGISMAEAKKRASQIDIEAFMRKAKEYVKNKDFSDQANAEMRLYNMTMKVNRLELLKARIALDMVAGHDELQTYIGDKLTDSTLETLRHNAAILGPTVMKGAEDRAEVIVNSSFHNATFSDRIWQHQDRLRNELTNILTNALISGKSPKKFIPQIRDRFGVSQRDAERLLRTEFRRVQIEAQKASYEKENIEEYEYIACGGTDCCDVCKAMDGKHFKVSKMVPGENAPPMHPNCHCGTAPHVGRKHKDFDEWLDTYKEHGLTYEEWKKRKDVINSELINSRANKVKSRSKKTTSKDTNKPKYKSFKKFSAKIKPFFDRKISEVDELKISDDIRYKIGNLPIATDRSTLLDGDKVVLKGYDLKRILQKHGLQFSYDEMLMIKDTIEKPDVIADNSDHHENSLIFYKKLPNSKRSVMECVVIKKGENCIIHYHKIRKNKINKLRTENKII